MDTQRFNPITPAQEQHLRTLFAERIVSLAQPRILFDGAPGHESAIGDTRPGDLPNVPIA